MSEWLAVEAIVKQRDKENQAHAIAKLSSESMSGEQLPAEIQRELSNEVSKYIVSIRMKLYEQILQVFTRIYS